MLENAVLRPHIDGISLSVRKGFMSATQRSEATLDRNQRREAEINEALKQEAARHAAAIKNMHRLRAWRRMKKLNPPRRKPNPKRKRRNWIFMLLLQPVSNLRQL
jgi:hypothetical protein